MNMPMLLTLALERSEETTLEELADKAGISSTVGVKTTVFKKGEKNNVQNLVLTRIDDRLIHGQVMTAWIRNRKADQVVIVDDGTANDEYMIEVLEMAIPEEIAIGIFTKEEGVQFFEQGLDAPTILLVKGRKH